MSSMGIFARQYNNRKIFKTKYTQTTHSEPELQKANNNKTGKNKQKEYIFVMVIAKKTLQTENTIKP